MTRSRCVASLLVGVLLVTLTGLIPSAAGASPPARRVDDRTIDRGDTLHIQFEGKLDQTVDASVYEVDCDDTPKPVVADLHDDGRTVDGYSNRSGFPLTKADQVRYNSWLAHAAHKRGLSPGLKNAIELIPALYDDFYWALNEECVYYKECSAYEPFAESDKAVFVLEYEVKVPRMC